MSEYNFLLNIGDDIINEVTLTRLIQNRRSSADSYFDFKVGVYTQKFESNLWEKLDEINFNDNSIVLRSTDYQLLIGQLAVIVPSNIGYNLADTLSELPEPVSGSSNISLINFRANISFIKGNSKSSFQGDFPYSMSRLKGSFLAFDALIHATNEVVKTKIVFVNIHSVKLDEKKYFNLNMSNSKSKKKLKKAQYVHNSVAIIDNVSMNDCSLVFYSKDTLGIPIFISFLEGKGNNMSVEHSHPPTEYFWGDSKYYGQSLIKSKWLGLLP